MYLLLFLSGSEHLSFFHPLELSYFVIWGVSCDARGWRGNISSSRKQFIDVVSGIWSLGCAPLRCYVAVEVWTGENQQLFPKFIKKTSTSHHFFIQIERNTVAGKQQKIHYVLIV